MKVVPIKPNEVYLILTESVAESRKVEELTGDNAAATSSEPNAEDVIFRLSANKPFSAQQGCTIQVIGTYTAIDKVAEAGIHGTPLPDGSTLRFGKVDDPANSGKKAIAFVLANDDPVTSGSRRTELSCPQKIEIGKTYWVAYNMFIPDWGNVPTSDVSTAGMQVHGRAPGTSPAVAVNARAGKTFWIDARHSTSRPPTQSTSLSAKSSDIPLPIKRWGDIVLKFRIDPDGQGFVQAWYDGAQVWRFNGRVGYYLDPDHFNYVKFGYYNWTKFNPSPRTLLIREMIVLKDAPAYDQAKVRNFINPTQAVGLPEADLSIAT